jgi:putative inorganic carbon (HCO3(-)) transporter
VNLKASKKRYGLIYTILFLIMLVAIIDTGCRGAYLGFLFFFPVLILALIYHIQKTLGGLSKIKKRYKNIFFAVICGLIAFIVTNPALIKRVQSIFALRTDSSISFRLNVYESVWRMFLDNIFLGIGVGNQNFREIYGLYMKTGFDALSAYNIYLETAVESGIFALIAFLLFLIRLIYDAVKYIFSSKNTANIIFAGACLISICSALFHGLVDTIYFRPQLQFIFWTYTAVIGTVLSSDKTESV